MLKYYPNYLHFVSEYLAITITAIENAETNYRVTHFTSDVTINMQCHNAIFIFCRHTATKGYRHGF